MMTAMLQSNEQKRTRKDGDTDRNVKNQLYSVIDDDDDDDDDDEHCNMFKKWKKKHKKIAQISIKSTTLYTLSYRIAVWLRHIASFAANVRP